MTNPYVVLLRGINVGGKNKVPMADLRALLEETAGFVIALSFTGIDPQSAIPHVPTTPA